MEISTKHKTLVAQYIEAYNRKDVDGMLKPLHPSITFENISGGVRNMKLDGKKAFEEQAQKAKALFSERNQKVLSWNQVEGQVIVELEFLGTLLVDLSEDLKCGDRLNMNGRSTFEFIDDQISRIIDES